ncbi:MAG TPA: hypothetical protein VKF84_06005 [Candidatus Sulfotelmatobacter sp.]|nr:hypothetical protein [Candidatus Sulfotelmatobacter sp.]
MINPISSVHPGDVHQVPQPAAQPRPDPQADTPPVPKSGALSHDQVTLRSAGQTDSDHK